MRLVDADALLQKFNDAGIQITFDLPVEEILGEDVDIDDFSMLVQDAIQAYKKMVIGTIKDIPTSYNVDKVVGKIKDLMSFYENCTKYGNKNAEQQEKSYGTTLNYEVADFIDEIIEIVRAGGID